MKKLFVLSGAGVSKESGIATFRDCKDGLWNNYKIEEVASPQGWKQDPQKVLDFYNERRLQVGQCEPNEAHKLIAKLQDDFDVTIFTQNIDNLHERAGSKTVFHLHGCITKARSEKNENESIEIGFNDINIGDVSPTDGCQLRPQVVFFDEFVNYEYEAEESCKQADFVLVIGTSLQVFPAAAIPRYRQKTSPLYIVDPGEIYKMSYYTDPFLHVKEVATVGMKIIYDMLMEQK